MSRLRHEAGQTIVLAAICLPLMLGLGAIAVDVGYWYVVKKTTQDAADAAALAAAAQLGDRSAATQEARIYVRANMPGAEEPIVNFPSATEVEVIVEATTETFFGRIFGLFETTVSGEAVAERLNSEGNVAIASFSEDCDDGLSFDGNMNIQGAIHSNGQFAITPDSDSPRWWAYSGTTVDCGSSVNPHRTARFGGFGYDDPTAELVPRVIDEELPWPTWYTPAQFGIAWPDGCPRRLSWTRSNATIRPGVYCASEEIVLDADNVTAHVTAIAPRITIEGDGLDLQPYLRRVLLFTPPNMTSNPADDALGGSCESMPDMEIRGSSLKGTIFSPCGRVRISGGDAGASAADFDGSILARQVSIAGDDFAMIGRSDFDVIPEVALTE